MGSERAVAGALVDWINSCPIEPKISSLSDLADGSAIAKVLLDIDPDYFKNPTASHEDGTGAGAHWVLRFQKLKRMHKALTQYYTETLSHRLPHLSPNLTAIVKDGNGNEAIKLVKIIVSAAVLSDRKEVYIERIQELSPSSQTELMNVINEMIALDQAEEDAGAQDGDETKNENDIDPFRLEEEMARLMAEKEAVEIENVALNRRLGSLQDHFDENQAHVLELQEELSKGDSSYANRTDPVLRLQLGELQRDLQRLEDIIAEREGTISNHERTILTLNRKVEDLLPKAEAGMKYKDDLDVANHTVEKLRKAQNVAEKYRKKLESMSELEAQMKTLEEQNAQMFKDIRTGEDHTKQVPGLKRTIEQYKKQISRLEAECAEVTRTKHTFETEKQILLSRVDGIEYQKSKEQERIRTLEEKIRELESGVIAEAADEYGGDLDSELTYTMKTKTDLKLKIARLEAELQHLKEGGGAGADNVVLQHRLDDVTRARDRLEKDYLQANTDKLVLESQLHSIRSGGTSEGSEVMRKLRQSLLDVEEQLSEIRRKHSETLAELNNAKRELVTARSDLSLVDKDKLEALSELKAAANTDLAELQGIHADLEKKYQDLDVEVGTKRSLLNTVLLEKDEISKNLSTQKDQVLEKELAISDLRATIAAFEGSAEGRDGALEGRITRLQQKLEDRRERMTKSKEHIKKQNAIIKDLQEQLDNAVKADADEKIQAMEERLNKKQEELMVLERETALMATAYHDQASRLQLNSVVLLRRSDAPASWLNKQRNALDSSVVRPRFPSPQLRA